MKLMTNSMKMMTLVVKMMTIGEREFCPGGREGELSDSDKDSLENGDVAEKSFTDPNFPSVGNIEAKKNAEAPIKSSQSSREKVKCVPDCPSFCSELMSFLRGSLQFPKRD